VLHAQVGWAGNTQVFEPFNYPSGSLEGLGASDTHGDFTLADGYRGDEWAGDFGYYGARWTSDWEAGPDSSLGFNVSSGTLSYGVTGGPDARGNYSGSMSRQFALDDTRNSWTFATTLTDRGHSGENFMQTMGFSGAQGDTAQVGIKNGQFYAQLGNTGSSTGQVAPNTPYTLVGQVQFGVPVMIGGTVQTGERLTLWVNKNFPQLQDRNEALMTLESAAGLTGIGNRLNLFALTNSNLTATKTWDDLLIGTYFQDVNGFRHDISPNGADVQDGYYSWNVGADGLSKTFPKEVTGYGDVTFRLGGSNIAAVDGGAAGGVAGALKRDGITAMGELTLSIEGLDPGDPYMVKTYHHHPSTQLGEIDVFLQVNGQEHFVTSLDPSTGDETAAHASFAFTPLDGEALVRFVQRDGGDVWLSGFEVVPEPSTLLLTIMGLVGMVAVGSRQHRKRINASR